MTYIKAAAALFYEQWSNLALRLAVPADVDDESVKPLDALEAEERQLRVLMSHWF